MLSNVQVKLTSFYFLKKDSKTLNGADYCFIVHEISKSEAIDVLQNVDLTEKTGT